MPREKVVPVEVKSLAEAVPARPQPLKLYDEPWKACEKGKMICLKPAEATRSLENKVEVRRWIGEASANMDYWERRSGASAR